MSATLLEFPRDLSRGPIEAIAAIRQKLLRMIFPRDLSRGPIEATETRAGPEAAEAFPRDLSRGPIEAGVAGEEGCF